MRSAIFALMTTLWFAATPGLARNGETGILVMLQSFEFVTNDQYQITSLVLCSADMERIRKLLEEGYATSIYLPGYGVFEVETNEEGVITLYQKDIEILSRECETGADASC